MSTENELNTEPEVTSEEPTEEFTDDSDFSGLINEFSDILGFSVPEKAPAAKTETEEAPQTESEQPEAEATAALEAGPAAVDEQQPVDPDPVNTNAIDAPAVQPSDKSQVIAQRAAQEQAQREAAKAQAEAIEQAKAEAAEELFRQFQLDPQGWIDRYGEKIGNVGEAAMHFYRKALGDKAPPELIKRTQRGPEAILSEVDRRNKELEQRLEAKQRALELQATANSYESYLNNLPDSPDVSYLKNAYSVNPAKVKQNLFNIADAMAKLNDGKYPTASELAAEYKRQVDEIVSLHVPKTNQVPSTPATKSTPKVATTQKPKTTLSESTSDRRSAEPSDEDLSDEALEQAALEYLAQHPIQAF